VATFSGLVLTTAGSGDQLGVSGGGLPIAETATFRVIPAAAAQLVFTRQPTIDLAAGASFVVGVSVEDAFGNLVPDSATSVSLALEGGPAGASLVGTMTGATSGGVATFDDLSIDRLGSPYRIQATSPGLAPAMTDDLDVTSSVPSHLVVALQPPSSVTAGSGFGLGVSIEDAYGNVVTGYDGSVSIALQGGPAGSTLSGSTSVRVLRGTATFSGLNLDRSGADVLTVTAGGLGTISTRPLNVTPAAPSQVVIVDEPPATTIAGQSFGLSAAVEDPYGNIATGYNGTVTASLAKEPEGGALRGGVSADAVNGVATFSGLTIEQAGGGYAVEASSGVWTSSPSTSISVSPAAASLLVVTREPPAWVVVKRPFAVGVEALDAYGNVATGFDGAVTAALSTRSGRAVLNGGVSVTSTGGHAVLGDLSVSRVGKSYSITITGSGLTPAVTSVYDVTRPVEGGRAAAVRRLSRVAFPKSTHAMSHTTKLIRPEHGHRPATRAGDSPRHQH
jgi:hypothetical protein